MALEAPNKCLWHSLGVDDTLDEGNYYKMTLRNSTKSRQAPEDFKENVETVKMEDDEMCYTEIKARSKPKRRDSLQIIRQSLNGDVKPVLKRKKLNNKVKGKKSKKIKLQKSSADLSEQKSTAEEFDQEILDIYGNKLWRLQMPTSTKLETIPEESCGKRSIKKEFRFIEFSDIFNPSKARQRLKRASKNGWKKVTKKRMNELEKMLKEFFEKY